MPVKLPPNAELKYKGVIYDVYQAPIKMFDGSEKTFEYVVRADCVTIFAFPTPHEILLTRQEQPARPAFFDFPGGRVNPGETHEQAALRELEEETGLRARRLKPFWNLTLEGATRFEKTFYLATDLEPVTDWKNPDHGERIQTLRLPFEDVVARCQRRELRQAEAMLCILNMEFDPAAQAELQVWLNEKNQTANSKTE